MRKERIAALTLSAALAFGLSVPALAVENGPENVVPTLISQQETAPLPDSMLYYGTISGIFRDEKGWPSGFRIPAAPSSWWPTSWIS